MALTSAGSIILFIVISGVAMSYGWGMRGTTIGGEAGAMLPGALMGLLIAVFSGSPFLMDHFYLLSAAGALGMYFGGSMSYGQTIGLTCDKRPPEALARGLVGLGLKGAIWFGLFGAVVGMFLSFLSGHYYDLTMVLIIFGLLPVFALGGSRLFDRPYDEARGIHPRIYFSRTRPEGMGVLFGILAELIIVMAFSKDLIALGLTLGGVLSGGIGWVLAQLLHIRALHPGKNGKRLFEKASQKGLIDAWKIMECVLGALGGIGIAATFAWLTFTKTYQANYTDYALPQLLPVRQWVLPAVFVLLLGLDMLRHAIKRPPTKAELEFQRNRSLISQAEYEIAMATASDAHPKAYLRYQRIAQIAQFPIYCIIPLFFLFLGSKEVAMLVSFYVVYYVLAEEQMFEHFNQFKTVYLWRALLLGFGFAVVLVQFLAGRTPGLFATILMYGAGYEALTLVWLLAKRSPERYKQKTLKEASFTEVFGSKITVHAYFIACIAVVTAFMAWVVF